MYSIDVETASFLSEECADYYPEGIYPGCQFVYELNDPDGDDGWQTVIESVGNLHLVQSVTGRQKNYLSTGTVLDCRSDTLSILGEDESPSKFERFRQLAAGSESVGADC